MTTPGKSQRAGSINGLAVPTRASRAPCRLKGIRDAFPNLSAHAPFSRPRHRRRPISGAELRYDDIIAPMFKEVADRCRELGMDLVRRVEWGHGEAVITLQGRTDSIGQMLTRYAALSRGNVDSM